jgi:purine-binding chemotaxis protein CheW
MVTGMESPRGQDPKQNSSAQFVGFEIHDQKYLFRIERIQEILTPGSVTRIPDVPAYVVGVSNLRGTIIPIVDLRLLFGLPSRSADANTRTIVVNVGDRTVGCMVDAVLQVIRIPLTQLHRAPDTVATDGHRSIEGFARSGDDLFILLDANSLIDPASLAAAHRAGVPGVPPPDMVP